MKYLLLILVALSLSAPAYSSDKPAPKVDCTQKKNAGKIECKAPPKSDGKPEIKKPEKVDRKAPAATQKKAAEENAKK
jgi:hypothetical protein